MIQEIHKKYGPVESYLAHSFGGLAVSLALEEINHSPDYRLVLIAPAAETSTAVDGYFKLLQLDPLVRPEFEKVIFKAGGVNSEWYSIRRTLKNIQAKVLWFQDEDDEITPMKDVLKVKAANYPNVEFVITKGLGHQRIYRDNKVINSIVNFL
jgi:alpha-beta hydrolase superfamily lysophospholipase